VQRPHLIAHSRLAAGTEAGQVLANLRIGHPGLLAEFATAHPRGGCVAVQPGLQGAQVLAQAARGRLRNAVAFGHGGSGP
jgi:hypothetical protein